MDIERDNIVTSGEQNPVATTLGDLIFAIMEAAEETCQEGESAGLLTQAVLGDLFKRSSVK